MSHIEEEKCVYCGKNKRKLFTICEDCYEELIASPRFWEAQGLTYVARWIWKRLRPGGVKMR